MECKTCQISFHEASKNIINEHQMIICFRCNNCKKCAINNKNNICKLCCEECKRCNKKVIKHDFPNEILYWGVCNSCRMRCKKCDKKTYDNVIFNKNVYCKECIQNLKTTKKTIYKPIIKLEKKPNQKTVKYVDKWIKVKQLDKCLKCDKNTMIKIKNNQVCDSCHNKNKIKEEKIIDPSNNNTRYQYIKIIKKGNIKEEWAKSELKVKCVKCCKSEWIKIKNISKSVYRCNKCSPNDSNNKYKYNKDAQKWEIKEIKKSCLKCKNIRWTTDNKCRTCNKNKGNLLKVD